MCPLYQYLHPLLQSFFFDATGHYSVWIHVISVPTSFKVTIVDGDENIPYTDTENGPCMPALQYWQDSNIGCPCNGNWVVDSNGGRKINPDECPNTSCPETFFYNDTRLYGNVRLNVTVYENGTIMNKTLEITKMSAIREVGYAFGAADVVYFYQLPKDSIVDEPNPTETPSPQVLTPEKEPDTTIDDNNDNPPGSGTSTIPLATTVTMIFGFLLMMYENTQ